VDNFIEYLNTKAEEDLLLAAHLHTKGMNDLREEIMPHLINFQKNGGSWDDIKENCNKELLESSLLFQQIKSFLTDENSRARVLKIWNERSKKNE